ncbi:MAG: hypothetical protein RLY14_2775 [Planctomycetota bacterium]|jgi:hypothetical protein
MITSVSERALVGTQTYGFTEEYQSIFGDWKVSRSDSIEIS